MIRSPDGDDQSWLSAPGWSFPAAETLQLLESAAPGTTERLLQAMEAQHASLNNARITWARAHLTQARTHSITAQATARLTGEAVRRTQWLAFTTAMGLTLGLTYVAHRGHALVAVAVAGLIATLIGALLLTPALHQRWINHTRNKLEADP